MSAPIRSRVLSAYADLFRAQRAAFRGDLQARSGAITKIRQEYRENSTISDNEKVEELLKYSAAVSEFLRNNLVQAAQKGKENNFELKLGNVNKKAYEPIVSKPKPPST